ncbi:MAG: glycosyltransferase family 2 protein [Winogradskyella sp.]|nr:glycosyltransferase family 2 protein [Winogradskyella sp.]
MIILKHHNNKVTEVLDEASKTIVFDDAKSIPYILYDLATTYPDQLLIWCNESYFEGLNKKKLDEIFHNKNVMASYSVEDVAYLTDKIGYVDQSIYIKVNKEVTYPTWLTSSDVGGVFATTLTSILGDFNRNNDFDYFLNAIAKTAMSQGLFCYSDPRLLVKELKPIHKNRVSTFKLFQFVKQHYKTGWVFFLFFCFMKYEKTFPILALLNALRYKRVKRNLDFSRTEISSTKQLVKTKTVDVIIPTIGRKKYLYDVLKDLSAQTLLPINVIIVEQNPDEDSQSQLEYLQTQQWPFNVIHKFIHQTGACNARNIALSLVKSEWVFFGDDDIRFNNTLIEDALHRVSTYGVKAINTVCLQPKEQQSYFKTAQTPIFGAGTSFVRSDILQKIKFDLRFEHGYGEDSDFGMQIRNLGEDVVFISDLHITHLKAPVGGYRTKHKQLWDNDEVSPKPSPTIILYHQRYFTNEQLRAYKLILFFKYYKRQSIKNPFKYYSKMKDSWNISLKWSHYLQEVSYD